MKKVLCWPLAGWLGLPLHFGGLSVDRRLSSIKVSHHKQGTCTFGTLLYVVGPSPVSPDGNLSKCAKGPSLVMCRLLIIHNCVAIKIHLLCVGPLLHFGTVETSLQKSPPGTLLTALLWSCRKALHNPLSYLFSLTIPASGLLPSNRPL